MEMSLPHPHPTPHFFLLPYCKLLLRCLRCNASSPKNMLHVQPLLVTANSAPFISRTRIGHKGLIFIAICDQIQYSCLQHVHVMTITEACGKNMSTYGRWWSRGTHFPGECQWTESERVNLPKIGSSSRIKSRLDTLLLIQTSHLCFKHYFYACLTFENCYKAQRNYDGSFYRLIIGHHPP